MISVFDIFKIGIGPSSSHTIGPMKACYDFIEKLHQEHLLDKVTKIKVNVYGSLSLTGLGHHTDIAVIMGLAGYLPHNVDIDLIPKFMQDLKNTSKLSICRGYKIIDFSYDEDLKLHRDFLPRHENALTVHAFDSCGATIYENTYYSIGGGFIVDDANFGIRNEVIENVPLPYKSATEMLQHCEDTGYSLYFAVLQNEMAIRSKEEITEYCLKVWQTMKECIQHGIVTEGILPGPLRVKRRAPELRKSLEIERYNTDPMNAIDWINMYALAVNEENAAGGRVVTAPTNGACGIVPAVLAYYEKFIAELNPETIVRYFLVCSFVSSLYKMNASISGAEVGCQGEVGVACSMAAAGLTEIMGGTPMQVCVAAEIAMEHNLGLTCDPVGGQVQVPCIERNAIAAVKAVNASRMALRRKTAPYVSLDKVIETMYETGKDMHTKYRETSQGGLAIKILNVCS